MIEVPFPLSESADTMQLYPLKLVTVIVEEVLKNQIQQEGLNLGATGFSTKEVTGTGSRGTRQGNLEGSGTYQIDFIVPDDVAVKILTHVSHKYFEHYACIAWVTNVAVVRGQHYVKTA